MIEARCMVCGAMLGSNPLPFLLGFEPETCSEECYKIYYTNPDEETQEDE